MSNSFLNTNFEWTPAVSIKNDLGQTIFSYTRTINVKSDQYFEVLVKFSKLVATNSIIEYHNPFSIFLKGFSNYYGIRGKLLNITKWDQEDNDKVNYFKNNFDDSPIFPKYCIKDISFNDSNRLFFYTLDFADTNKNVFENSDKIWNFDGYPQIRAVTDNTEMACIIAKNPAAWTSKTCYLTPGNNVTYNKTSNTAYLFVLNGPITINNSVQLNTDDVSKISSNTINITLPSNATEYATILIKESVDE
jgi:hypothetical protein